MTFSMMGYCKRTRQFGTCSATWSPATGSRTPAGNGYRGVACVQAYADPALTLLAGRLLDQGLRAPAVVATLRSSDSFPEYRQIGVIDANGGVAVTTGQKNIAWAGHVQGEDHIAMANVVVGEKVVQAMAAAFSTDPALDLSERLLRAIEAGRDAGGQADGQRSSYLYVFSPNYEYPYVDLRVDVHPEPVGELRRVFDWQKKLIPYYAARGMDPRLPRYPDWLARQDKEAAR